MKILSLFSGIGGFDLAFQRAGATHLALCEIDKTCQSILRRHFPKVKIISNVKTINKSDFSFKPDVIVGGFPCQDVSVAGKRKGLAGERSGLWFEFVRIIGEYQPRWVVIENVPGLLSGCGCLTCQAVERLIAIHSQIRRRKGGKTCAVCTAGKRMLASHSGRNFAIVLSGLVKCGYGVCWRILDSQFDGVAQRRRRVFIVASLGSGDAAEILFERDGGAWDSPARKEARQDVAATLRAGASGRSAGAGQTANGNGLNLVTGALSARSSAGGGLGTDFECDGGLGTDFECDGGLVPQVAGTLAACGAGTRKAAGQANELDFLISGTVSSKWAKGTGGPSGNEVQDLVFDFGQFGVRRLTPTECERLQGFPDGWTAFDDEGNSISDSARYSALGNAVCVPTVEWIARRIVQHDSNKRKVKRKC